MPPVSRTNCIAPLISSSVYVLSSLEGPGTDLTGEDQPFSPVLKGSTLRELHSAIESLVRCPLRAGQASLAWEDFPTAFWHSGKLPACGGVGCSENLDRTFDKQKASLPFTAVALQKETKQKVTQG